MERKNVVLDENWVKPSFLAAELGIRHTTVTNWIKRDQIDFLVLPGVKRGKHLVDRRTAPGKRPKGQPRKKTK